MKVPIDRSEPCGPECRDTKAWSPCPHCGAGAPYTPGWERYCSNAVRLPGSGPAEQFAARCNIALVRREPLLVDSGSGEPVQLEFGDFPDAGEVTIGHLRRDNNGEGSFGYIDLAESDGDGLVKERHAIVTLRDGRFFIRKGTPEAMVEVNDRGISGEVELTPMCRVRLSPRLLYYFIP